MAKGYEEIQAFHAARKANILKGFKEVSEVPPVSLGKLQEQVGKENIYTYEVLKGFTQEVLEKGEESERLAAKEQISNLTPVAVVDERGLRQVVYVEKGHMDFDSSGGGRQGLVKKQITDKTGKQTTRWVRQGEEDKGDEKQPKGEEETEDENPDGTKPISEHAKETPTEELKRYLEENPDGEHATHAKRELQVRGELEGGDEAAEEGVEESTTELDFNNSEAVKQYLADNPETKEKMMAIIEEDLFISPISALKQAMKGDIDQSETHAVIDEAQASLDALKEKVGHPSTSEEDGGTSVENKDTVNDGNDEGGDTDNQNTTLDEKGDSNNKELYDRVRDWVGEDYKDEHIESILDALEDGDGFDEYLGKIPTFKSQEDETDWINDKVIELRSEIPEGMHHADLSEEGIKDILWGLVSSRMD